MKTIINISLTAYLLSVVATPAMAAWPEKPITIYVSYAAGATTDITARALSSAAEKILGVPVTIENKAGGGGTVAAGLLASKKPDGYTLLIGSSAPLTVRPSLMKVSYKPSDIVGIIQYSYFYNGAVVINADSPIKDIDAFVAYAKAHPGLSYGTAGSGGVATTSQQIGVEILKKCKGLEFKHVPTKGGTEANTMLMGKHLDFTSGSGSHLPFVVDGVFRQLVIFQDARDENFPDMPTLREIGCEYESPPNSAMIISAPRGLPAAISQKLEQTFTQIVQSDEFKAMLKRNFLPYDFKDSRKLAADLEAETQWYKKYFISMGVQLKN